MSASPHYSLALRRAFVVAACTAMSACAPSAVRQDAASASPETGVATVTGWGHSAAENARAAATPEQGTRVTRLYVAFYDGKKTSFGENVVRIPPGDRELIVTCGVYINYRFFSYDERLPAKLQAGRVYQLRAYPEGRRCQPYLEDVTGKKG